MELDGNEKHPGLDVIQAEANLGVAEAQFQLGLDYLYGFHDAEASPSLAVVWLSQAGVDGEPLPRFFLSIALEENDKVDDGLEILRELAERDFLPAYARLASHYIRGKNVEKDIEKAKLLLKKGVLRGHLGCDVALSLAEVLHPKSVLVFIRNLILLPVKICYLFVAAYKNPWQLNVLT